MLRKATMVKSTKSTARTTRSTPRSTRSKTQRQPAAKTARNADRTVRLTISDAMAQNVGDVQTLTQFLETAGVLTKEERLTIVTQARRMLDQTYVHLPLKRAMHAVDPVQRLRLLEQRLDGYTERAFHNEMILI